ncbi:MAG: hypothetical protein A2340_07590 [Lentisphaerae bacterium RIFOXYB12_FULL_60_10]|nr:MAG: hypothetical protein A2340_07590 [Lentisphaerae bacterium RIFOXYB12_FULL_60_10]
MEIKICGMTNRDDVRLAMDLGVDYVGFVLYPPSPRAVTALELVRLVDQLPSGLKRVGVFVNTMRSEVEQVAADAGLYAVQLHGDEDPVAFEGFPGLVWRAVRLATGSAPVPDPAGWKAHRYVVDAAVVGRYGGTGVRVDDASARALASRLPILLAGGLTPDNVQAAIRMVRPLGVDVAGGVEQCPGRKDPDRLRRFVEAVRNIDKTAGAMDG